MTNREILTSKIQQMTTNQLCDMIVMTEFKTKEEGVPILRESVINELEIRNPIAFESWLESDNISPISYFA